MRIHDGASFQEERARTRCGLPSLELDRKLEAPVPCGRHVELAEVHSLTRSAGAVHVLDAVVAASVDLAALRFHGADGEVQQVGLAFRELELDRDLQLASLLQTSEPNGELAVRSRALFVIGRVGRDA